MEATRISYKLAIQFLLSKHYSGRKPSMNYAFGLWDNGLLVAVCTFGKPASPALCTGICGVEFKDKVFELNRLCRKEDVIVQLSQFVAYCLRELSKEGMIIVSYADTGMNHTGFIYQALNFIYTGKTLERTDKYTEGNKHSRHYDNDNQNGIRKVRSAKHRYVFFATKNKREKKEWLSKMTYEIQPYPKEPNQNYILGEFQQPKLTT